MIYLDNAATTKMDPAVLEAMLPYLTDSFCNPSAQYSPAQREKMALEQARGYIASTLNAQPREIYFTSGGTESDNWALKGIALANAGKGKHVVVSAVEHHAILNSAHWLERNGFEVSYAPVGPDGIVDVEAFARLVRPDTVLCSVMLVNNEVGTIQPIKELARIAHEAGALFHSDAVQAYGHMPVNVTDLGIDALSASAHKLHGPKGCGFLYCKRGVAIDAFIHGGAQERGFRAGTENLAAIAGMKQAACLAYGKCEADGSYRHAWQHAESLNRLMRQEIGRRIPDVRFNGSPDRCAPYILSASFEGVSSETLLLLLDQKGICASAGSACASGSLDPSHVLLAMGLPHQQATGTLRFSFSSSTTAEEVLCCCKGLEQAVAHLRRSFGKGQE